MKEYIKNIFRLLGFVALVIATFVLGIGAILYVVIDLLLNAFPW